MKMKYIEHAAHVFLKEMLQFMQYLRTKNFAISTGETIDVFRMLEEIPLADETEVMLSLRTVLCSTRTEHEQFESMFNAFFHGAENEKTFGESADGEHAGQGEKAGQPSDGSTEIGIQSTADTGESTEQVGFVNGSEGGSETKDISFLEAVRQSQTASKQYSTVAVSLDQYAAMGKVARSFIRSMKLKPSRRWQPQPHGTRIDVRRTLRKSVSTGGYAIDPAMSGHRKKKARFILLCDGSRSMAPYTDLFLQFAAALYRQTAHMELFLFSTEVKRVTHLLSKRYPPKDFSFTKLGSEWGGGTCIGTAIKEVIRTRRLPLLTNETVFIIFSDGLESGDLNILEQSMQSVKKQVDCIVWLNPLLGKTGYEPLARGMQLALQYTDVFAEADHIKAFQKLPRQMRMRRGTF